MGIEAKDKPIHDLKRDLNKDKRARRSNSFVEAVCYPISTIHEKGQFSPESLVTVVEASTKLKL